MWELVTGLLGVLVGAFLVSFLERRNWQRQETMKAYADLFTVGDEALRWCYTIANLLDNLSYELGESFLAEAEGANPKLRKEYDRILSLWQDFSRAEDQRFRHLLTQCWMLEREPETRSHLKELEKQYKECKAGLERRRSKVLESRKKEIDAAIEKKPSPDTLFQQMESLKIEVARQYFHGEGRSGGKGTVQS
jgi:hypothetical protein